MDPITTPEINPNVSVAANIDSELDAALNKSFDKSFRDPVQPVNKMDAPTDKVEPKVESKNDQASKPEIKVEEKASVKPVDEKPVLTPDEIDKIDPKDKGAWGAIKNANKMAHATIAARDSEITKIKTSFAEKIAELQKKIDEHAASNSELEKYRAMVDIQADPEFVSTYDQPIDKAISGIKEMISSLGVTKETVDGIDFKDPSRLEQVIDLISQNRDRFTASKIERKIKEYLELNDKRDETLQEHKNNYKETLEKKKKESFSKQAEGEGRMINYVESFIKKTDAQGNPAIPFLNKITPKEGIPPGEADHINRHNALVDTIKGKIQVMLKAKEPEHIADLVLTAATSFYLDNQLKAVTEQLKKSQEELQKISVVSTETPSRKPVSAGRNGNHEPLDHDSALSKFFKDRR